MVCDGHVYHHNHNYIRTYQLCCRFMKSFLSVCEREYVRKRVQHPKHPIKCMCSQLLGRVVHINKK